MLYKMYSSGIILVSLVLSRFQALGTTAVFTKRLSNAESANSKICPDILQKFDRGLENINILVNFVQGTDTVFKHTLPMKFSDRREHALGTYFALKWHADKTQDNLIQKLSRDKHGKINLSVHFHKYWLTNQLIVKGAELDLIREIAEFEQVAEIKEEPVASLIQSVDDNSSGDETSLAPGSVPWNLEQIYVPETWKELHGKNGGGTVVGFMGSGVNGKHIALQDKFLGEYGWLDPVNGSLTPTETGNGQGTHAVGIAVGGKGIGIASGARWAACKACSQNICPYHFILHCAQFWACPTLSNGTNMDCTKSPHVLLNLWAGDKDEYGDIIKGWHAFGIIPIFPLATCGSGSVMHPVNDSRILAMASRDNGKEEKSKVATTPKYNRQVIATKSNLVAPGNRVLSADFNSKTGYKLMSGATQASAHAVGLIALLFAREPELSFDKAKRILEQASDQSVCVKGCGCGNLNALNALKVQRALRWS